MAGLVQYNFTIDDTSPVLKYAPYADFASASGHGDGLQNGWQTWYTASGYLSDPDGPSPIGESFHLTSLSGASVSLSFYGTGVALYGTSNCSSYEVTFDDTIVNATLVQGIFFSTSDAVLGSHNVTLTPKPDSDDQIFSFKSAIVTSGANSTASSPYYLTIDNQNTTAITYSGDWVASNSVSNIPSSVSPAPFHSTSASGASASLNFIGRAIALYGSTTTNHGQYSVTLNGARQVFNGSSQWLLGNVLMFYQDGLDENSTHSLNLTNLGDGALSLNSVKITQLDSASGDSNNADTHGKTIIGAIVGPVIAFIVVASVVGLCFWTKRRAKHLPNKLERRSSIASSIFLPQKFRREYNGRDDRSTPYTVNLAPSDMDIYGFLASSVADVPSAYQHHGSERERDEKGKPLGPLPAHVALPLETRGIDGADTVEHRSRRSFPMTYTPSEVGALSPGDSARSSTHPRSPTYPPGTSSVGLDGIPLVERIMQLVAQRIDTQRSLPNSTRADPVDRLPPYQNV